MLGAHDDGITLLKLSNQIPDLLPRLDIKATGRLIQYDRLCTSDECHSQRQLTFHTARALFDKFVSMFVELASFEDLIDLLPLVFFVNSACSDAHGKQ